MTPLALAAFVVVVLHVLVLALLGERPPGPFLSNAGMVLSSVLATASCLAASARARGFARSLWRLAALALGTWSLAQLTWTYTEDFQHAAVAEPSWTRLLFRLYGAPFIVALLLDEEDYSDRFDSVRVLDFIQVGLLFLLFYFDFSLALVPGQTLASLQVASFLHVSDLENWLIAAAFALRAFFARTRDVRHVFGRLSLFLVAYAVASTIYTYGYYVRGARTAEWFDLPWPAALGLATLVSATWQPLAGALPARGGRASALRVFTVHWVAAVVPLAVVALALQMARYELAVACATVFASVALFGARMLIERYRQEGALVALRASEERYARLVDRSPQAIAVVAEGRIAFANPSAARMAGAPSPQDLVGRPLTDFVTPEIVRSTFERVDTLPEGSPPVEIDTHRLDGSSLRVEVAFIDLPPLDSSPRGDGEARARLVVAQDVTERRRAEGEREALIRELEARNSELERFSYTVSHDLKSPLVTIKGFAGLVQADADRGDLVALRADLARIDGAADRMGRLLNELLELSRVGRAIHPPEEVALDLLVRDVVANAESRLVARGVEVRVQPGMPVVFGDRIRLLEVVQNLVDNAVKFFGDTEQPRLEIGCSVPAAGPEIAVFVRDNGIGIDKRFHDRVFGLFQTLDPSGQGTGIGLALVKRIVEVHGGRTWVESEGEGRGSTFWFTLPLTPTARPLSGPS
jgi:PAS domain S-box-containing protein